MEKSDLYFLQEEVKRVSAWIRFADQKTAFLAIYYSAIFGLLISNRQKIELSLQSTSGWGLYFFYIILILEFFSFFTGAIFLILSVFPRLNNSLTEESLFYFGNVSNMKYIDFIKKLKFLTKEETKMQMAEQIYTNSLIANAKMINITISIKLLVATVIFSTILLIWQK